MKGRIIVSILGMLLSASMVYSQSVTINEAVLPSSNHQVETTIAVNPTNRNNLVAGAIIITPDSDINLAYYYSFDGGNTWAGNQNFPGANSRAADPVVAFDNDGVAYYLYQIRNERKLFLHTSTDGGQTWSSPVTVVAKTAPKSVDKPWMAVSPVKNSSNHYEIFVLYTETDDNDVEAQTIWQATSSDGGTAFTNFQAGSPSRLEQGAYVTYNANGSPKTAWGILGAAVPFPLTNINLGNIAVTQIGTAKLLSGSWAFVLKNSEVRVNSYPSIAIDRSEGPNSGHIYLAWADQRFGDPDILLSKSTDGGFTWTSPIRVNNDALGNGKDQWFPNVTVDPDGNVNVIFYDSRNSLSNQQADLTFARSTNGGQSFGNNLIGSSFTVNSVPNGNFMGDYIQLDNWTGESYLFWNRWVATRYQAYFTKLTMPTVSVTVKNDFGGQQFGDFTVHEYPDNPVSYPSGTVFSWPNPSLRKIEVVDRYDNPFGDVQNWQFRDWNDQPANTVNPQAFTISDQTLEIIAVFKEIHPVTVQTDLEASGNHSGSVQFKDPLGSGTYETQSSPFSRDDVFQEETPPYGVGALSTLNNVLSTDWYFQAWEDGNTNLQRDISPPGPESFTALYKGHLRSNTTSATAPNNQRKMVYDGSIYHLVYESMGDVWYTTTTGADNAWSAEVRLSDGSGDNKHPCIDVTDNDIVVVVWQRDGGGAADEIVMRRKLASGWTLEQTVAEFFASGSDAATPVVAASFTAPYYFFIWHDFESDNLKIRSFDEELDAFGSETNVSSTNSSSINPSLTADTNTKLHLVWQESGSIYYTKINHNDGGNYSFSPGKENVSSGAGYSDHKFPSVTTDYSRRPNVAWQAYSGVATEMEIILHCRRELGGSWSSAVSFSGNEDYVKPSITSFPKSRIARYLAPHR